MKLIKKFLSLILWIGIIFSLNFSLTQWLWTGNMNIVSDNPLHDPKIEWEHIPDNPTNNWWRSFNDKLNWIIKIPSPSDYETSLWYTMRLIQIAINRLLWMLSFVALVYMLYCWFLVFSSWSGDTNAKKGKKWITTAATALAGIWLSRLIISAMIRLITNVANAK